MHQSYSSQPLFPPIDAQLTCGRLDGQVQVLLAAGHVRGQRGEQAGKLACGVDGGGCTGLSGARTWTWMVQFMAFMAGWLGGCRLVVLGEERKGWRRVCLLGCEQDE